MTFLSNRALDHLRRVAEHPELPGDRYTIVGEIARGGMGTVYLACDEELERRVALKVLNATELGEDGRTRMAREARILAQLEHPGIVPVHDVGTLADGRIYYTMKLVEGERLDDHVRQKLGLRERLRIFERMCEAVSFAHAHGVIHRDLKPSNVMVGPFGEVLVMDWGVAKIVDDAHESESAPVPFPIPPTDLHESETLGPPSGETRPGMVLGTPGYMAPEQAAGRTDLIDARADVYALGVMLKELMDGAADVRPRRLRAIADKALSEELDRRYTGVPELSADVASFLDGERVSAYREGLGEIAMRWFDRYRAPILLILTYLVVRALILVVAGT